MTVWAEVNPALLVLARERSGKRREDLSRRFPKLIAWEAGALHPTLKQLDAFVKATHTSVGLLLLSEPPDDQIPIPDYRTVGDVGVRRPSADLLDTITSCEQRQEWYSEFARLTREDQVDFVGSLSTSRGSRDDPHRAGG